MLASWVVYVEGENEKYVKARSMQRQMCMGWRDRCRDKMDGLALREGAKHRTVSPKEHLDLLADGKA